MAITHVGITAVQSFSSTITLALPVGVQAGDLLIANVVIGAGATVNLTVPASWTIAQNDTPDAFRHSQWVAYAIYDGSSSYEFSLSAVKGSRLVVNAYRDVNQASPVESSGKAYINGGSINSAVLSVANANSVEFACCADVNGASRTFTAPAGTTELFNSASYPSMTIYDRSVSPSATTAQTVTVSPNTLMSLMNLVINPAGGGTAYSIIADTVTDSHTANDVTLTYAGAATAYTLTADTVSDTHAAGDVTLTYSAAGAATITSEPLKDNTGALLANQALDYVAIYDNITGALVLRVTGISTNASGVFTVSDAALTAGVTYKLDWKVTIQSAARMPAKAAV